jgi:hypothetical protein
MSNARIRRDLPNDEYQAAIGANNPSASNVFATIADLTTGTTTADALVVYVNGADGTNILVGKADYSTEATSSKTLGLLITSGANNAFSTVVTQGSLKGTGSEPLDTSAGAAGDPVWLGDDGNLIYGLANKPYAPNHLVFIGIVVEANPTVGEIYVKVQNGFELEELHDVDLITTPPVLGDVLTYDGTLWVPQASSSSFGPLGIADSLGQYTYYSNYTTAMAAAVAGQTIEQFADIVEPNNVTITITPGVNINMNGHTYTSTYSVADIILFSTTGSVATDRMQFINGTIIIDSGAVGHTGIGGNGLGDVDCTGLFIRVISSGGLGSAWTSRGTVRNLRGESIDSTCAGLVRATAYNCTFNVTGTGLGVSVGGNSLGTTGSIYDSRVSSADLNWQGQIINCECGSVTMTGGSIQGGSITTLSADTEYTAGLHSSCGIRSVRINSTSTLRAASTSSIGIINCDITGTITISDDTAINRVEIYNCSIASSSSITNCITKAAGTSLTVTARYANNVFRLATTPVNSTVLQGIVNTEDNQGNILV